MSCYSSAFKDGSRHEPYVLPDVTTGAGPTVIPKPLTVFRRKAGWPIDLTARTLRASTWPTTNPLSSIAVFTEASATAEAKGLLSARQAVRQLLPIPDLCCFAGAYCAYHQHCEAYSFVFRLLAIPAEEVLVQ